MKRTINDFPTELVRLVLTRIKLDSMADLDGSLFNTLTVCRLWHEIGEELLWTDICLNNSRLAKFCKSSCKASRATKSLSVQLFINEDMFALTTNSIYSVSSFSSEGFKLMGQLEQLSLKIREMRHLESFSMLFSKYSYLGRARVPLGGLRSILDALPNSVRNLEIDDEANGFHAGLLDHPQDHLCISLQKIMPQLRNLRLKLAEVCGDVFPDSPCKGTKSEDSTSNPSRGSSFILQLAGNEPVLNTMHCRFHMHSRDYYFAPGSSTQPPAYVCLVDAARSAIASHALDNFHRISIFDMKYTPVHGKGFPCLRERALRPEDKLRLSPCFQVPTAIGPSYYRVFRTPGGDGKTTEVIGWMRYIIPYAENGVWVETEDYCRLPATYINENSRFEGTRVNSEELNTRRTFTEPLRGSVKLWDLEDQEGCILLDPLILDGQDDTRWPTRKPTLKEMQREERRKAIERGEEVEPGSDDDDEDEEDDVHADYHAYEYDHPDEYDDDDGDDDEIEFEDYDSLEDDYRFEDDEDLLVYWL
ncbi:uncharacterized protein PV07_01518 [Cladophialophora immunda]|uniref:F-box domain-containing protein n=1 Tax=Cladophialophora immunda TaxID=569365 RepID=A0A0D2CXW4_9EURO|nr:uncharacterized protein PV07_01518 [Cladophialophora immunda]KIW34760.1 hypothetical protein PV07_01518 [Cladophialophora immunda]OQV08734.1 hypothetical protein CLAIMM_12960 [Cladophialophora immunda]